MGLLIVMRFLSCEFMHLLFTSSETFEKPIERLNKDDRFFISLLEILHPQVLSRKGAVIAAVQFLNTVTEDNPVLIKKFAETPAAGALLLDLVSLKSQGEEVSTLTRTLTASEFQLCHINKTTQP